ncbi:hypothetical protein [Mycolicibacterium pulveris]|uniref:hypothetical protein n=1 Tax=Mycolicibacterium pulveris TaxID=36813 RepID=UPI003CEF755C
MASIADARTIEKKETQLQLALRPYVTTGVAIVGASVIAATPITPTPTPVEVQSHAVQLTASSTFVDPVTRWIQVFQATAANLTELVDYLNDHPGRSLPGLLEFLQAKANGYGYALFGRIPQVVEGLGHWSRNYLQPGLQMAIEQLASGQPAAAVETVKSTIGTLFGLASPLFGMMGVVTLPSMLIKDIADITRAVTAPLQLIESINSVLNLAWSPVLALGITAQKVIDAVEAGDLLGAVGALLNAPADAVDHFLNAPGGLVEVTRTGSTGQNIWGGLLVQLLAKIPRAIMLNLDPPLPVTAAVADTSVATGTMVTLETGAPEADVTEPATDPGPVDPPATAVDQTATDETTEELPATEETEEATESEEGTEPDGATEPEESTETEDTTATEESDESPNGSTDLSDGNMAGPGETGTGSGEDSGSTSDGESESPADGATGDDTEAGGTSDNTGSGDAGGSSDGSDAGSES